MSDLSSVKAETADEAKPADSGLLCLAFISGHYQINVDLNVVFHDAGLSDKQCTSDDILRISTRLGLKSKQIDHQSPDRLASVPLPAILPLQDGRFVIAALRFADGRLRIIDPVKRSMADLPAGETPEGWGGRILLMAYRPGFMGLAHAPFGFAWFMQSVWRYRWALMNVLVASLFVQLFALATPLLFQVVIDKVLVHKGYSTLLVVVVGLIVMSLFEVVLQYLRSYALAHTTSRIDVELGAKLFDHMLRLPISYYDTRAAGQTVARVRELETIRAFLTGQGLSSVIDILFAVVFIAVMSLYSTTLTLIVLLSIPLYVAVSVIIRPLLRDKINERFETGASSQQLLVETVVGFQTLKAAAVEPSLRLQWENRLAAYVRASFEAVKLATMGQSGFQLISKITTALVLYFGAKAVIEGTLSVGGLIAFNMMMGQAIAPVLRLSQVWQDLQQVMISVDRVGDILRSPVEVEQAQSAGLGPIAGNVAMKGVSFRYHPDSPETIRGLDLAIPAGQVIGIVGPSGSGKSTVTKLLQRLYRPERGQILIDDIDIAHVDASSLRRQIGVVLQDNMLFNRTVHDNIALAHPAMPRTQVMALARLAGADEFIGRLPKGYETMIEERGANLSGGQRQRIAIARALSMNPRILILDEATSALDYESESQIQANMALISKGRTVIIIAHRLAAVKHCDRIITLQDGTITEDGSHDELLEKADGFYARLWQAQSRQSGEGVV